MKKLQVIVLLIVTALSFYAGVLAFPEAEGGSVITHILGVDSEGEGVIVTMSVSVVPGTGRILVNIDNPSFVVDTQESMRNAVEAAVGYTGISRSEHDYIFSVEGESRPIAGPSAGASMSVALVAAIEGKQLKKGYYVTGEIAKNGSITRVGGILEKARALSPDSTLIVPEGQGTGVQPVESCVQKHAAEYYYKECTVEYKEVDVFNATGVKIIEVKDLAELANNMLE